MLIFLFFKALKINLVSTGYDHRNIILRLFTCGQVFGIVVEILGTCSPH